MRRLSLSLVQGDALRQGNLGDFLGYGEDNLATYLDINKAFSYRSATLKKCPQSSP